MRHMKERVQRNDHHGPCYPTQFGADINPSEQNRRKAIGTQLMIQNKGCCDKNYYQREEKADLNKQIKGSNDHN